MNHLSPWIGLLFCLLAGGTVPAQARTQATFDCQAPQAAERALCNDEGDLIERDEVLVQALAAARRRHPAQGAQLAREQADWLRQRADCGANTDCIQATYDQRLQAVLARLQVPTDRTDAEIAGLLQQALKAQLARHPDWPLEKAWYRFILPPGRIASHHQRWHGMNNEDDDGNLLEVSVPARRPRDVSRDEWAALQHLDSPTRMSSYSLVDLDGDGRRDLVIGQYEPGGTGLMDRDTASSSTYFNVMLRRGPGFAPVVHRSPEVEPSFRFHDLDGWSNTRRAQWIAWKGRVYAVHVEEDYEGARVSLLRPSATPSLLGQWTLTASYTFSVPARQPAMDTTRQDKALPRDVLAALQKSVAGLGHRPEENEAVKSSAPTCPTVGDTVEPFGQPAEAGTSGFGGPTVAFPEFPVWFGSRCRMARFVASIGYGRELDMDALLLPASAEERSSLFKVRARRTLGQLEGGPLPKRFMPRR